MGDFNDMRDWLGPGRTRTGVKTGRGCKRRYRRVIKARWVDNGLLHASGQFFLASYERFAIVRDKEGFQGWFYDNQEQDRGSGRHGKGFFCDHDRSMIGMR